MKKSEFVTLIEDGYKLSFGPIFTFVESDINMLRIKKKYLAYSK